MNKFSRIIICSIITMLCFFGFVIVGSSSEPVLGQGNGDNWGVDIFTDNWSTPNVTTEKTTVKDTNTTKEKITTKENNLIERANVKKIVIKKRTAKIYLKALKNVSGYKVKFSTSAKFSKAKTKSLNVKKAKITIKKITKAKRYYVKARAFRKTGGKIYYGRWSKVKIKKYQW